MLQRCRPCLLRALALAARDSLLAGSSAREVSALVCGAHLAPTSRAVSVAASWPAHVHARAPDALQRLAWQRQGLRAFASAPAAAEAPADAATGGSSAEAPVQLTDTAVQTPGERQRLRELLADVAKQDEKVLRLTVEAGGCSGFSYNFNLDTGARDDDLTFEREGVALVVDAVSYEFVRGASIDFVDSLIKSTFEVVQNPNSASSCGCGSSFTPKF